jgi:hypothetical protein
VDNQGTTRTGKLVAHSLSALYELKTNDKVGIRFNPRRPAQIYCADEGNFFRQYRVLFWILIAIVTGTMLLESARR